MFERPDTGDRALLVHIDVDQRSAHENVEIRDLDGVRAEFVELAHSAGLEVVDLIIGSRHRPDPRHFIGKGKIEEIRLLLEHGEIDVVLFGQSLSPSQERNLERELKVRVLDRSSLILDIFAQRARSFEGKLQVELAQLTHLSTRLVRGWTHLERQKGGIGLRGPGETQLETDRRLLADRVKMLRKRLDRVRQQREQGRSQRGKSGVATVALVGYTNAGKSTLFNALTSESVYAADQLFATLDPTLRRLELAGGRVAVMADTVGFVQDLPHELVDAFRSTLTETREADLLLHVIDVSDEERDLRRADVDTVLKGIGAESVPQLLIYNKTDRLDDDLAQACGRIDRNDNGDAVGIWLSAKTGDGLDALQQVLSERLSGQRTVGWLTVLPEQGRLRSQLFAVDAVREERSCDDGGSMLHIDVDAVNFARLSREHRIKDRFVPDVPPDLAAQQA